MKRLSLALPLLLVHSTFAQQPVPAGSDHELIQQLLRRVNELEAEVRALKQTPGGAPAAEAVQPPAAPAAAQTPAARPAMPPDQMMHDAQMPAGLPAMRFQGFSDVGFHASDASGDHSSFALGEFNLFITSQLSDKVGMLGEMVVKADSKNAFGISMQRLLLQYSVNDYLNMSAGRDHTAIGFYNTAYHHATWLQTTVDRPFLFAFESDGGILPLHNVGLSATGRLPSGGLGLHYLAEVGNGRTSASPLNQSVQSEVDENNRKAVNFALFARPDAVRGFQAGVSYYRDRLYPAGQPGIGEGILAGHAIYRPSGFEFMNEALLIRHAVGTTGAVFNTPGFYSQISKQFGKVRPYFRYEYINVSAREPVFGFVGLRHGPTTGFRFDFSDVAAFKLEYDRVMRRTVNATNGLRTQLSFTF